METLIQTTDPWVKNEINFRRLLKSCEDKIQKRPGDRLISDNELPRYKIENNVKNLFILLNALKKADDGRHTLSPEMLAEYQKKIELLQHLLLEQSKLEKEKDAEEKFKYSKEEVFKQSKEEAVKQDVIKELPENDEFLTGDVDNNFETDVGLRSRRRREELFGSRVDGGLNGLGNGEKSLEDTIKYEKNLQDDLMEDISNVMGSMKTRLLGLNENLKLDTKKLENVQDAFDKNLDTTVTMQKRLDVAIASTTSSCRSLVFIFVSFLLAVLLIKFLPKQI